eukprot:CAMPEP_0202869694 /NCGR_PEP_ID=MMETSP1391-20130828/12594_1 /ASSEMBLY_ACC=CAM_ASM_000867 /TAXON_ID=1034604 /ORGANISM="Chlamydomonas leiostraca, Strain SAG 11-49" /LENGTH=235 /DNA_ID=CAMNT_0049550037 /DNA_START=93 /DNA_END=797 /DNA_ORIENTATION=-
MFATLPRLATRLATARAGFRPQRALPRVFAFKAGEEREKTDVAKAEHKTEKAVQRPAQNPMVHHPIRRLSDAVAEMNHEMERMMSAFGLDPFFSVSPWSVMDRMAEPLATALDTPAALGRLVPVQVEESDKAYTFHAEVPGFKKGDIKITFDPDSGMLTLRGERKEAEQAGGGQGGQEPRTTARRHMSFVRSFMLPKDAATDAKGWKAVTADGVLTLTVPKAEKPAPQHIEIDVE